MGRSKAKSPLDHEPGAVTWARTRAKLTRTQLAAETGVSLSLISEIEKGSRNAQPTLIEAMAEVLGCPAADLKRKPGQAAARMAAVCVRCSALWEPDHECQPETNGAAALQDELAPAGQTPGRAGTHSRIVANRTQGAH